MNNPLLTIYAFNLRVCESLMSDISQDEMLQQPSSGVNPPAWLLGHLALGTDYALKMMDQPMRLPNEWHEQFGPGSKPEALGDKTPKQEELLIALKDGHAAVAAALPEVAAERLAEPNPLTDLPFLVETLPTVGDLLAHLLTTHEAAHLGHLSNWRRQMGRPPLF